MDALRRLGDRSKVQVMRRSHWRLFGIFTLALTVIGFADTVQAEAPPAALAGFEQYAAAVEARMARQHASATSFLAPAASGAETRMRQGELVVEQLTPEAGLPVPGATLYHWRGTAFAQGARPADFESLLRDLPRYPSVFAPQVTHAAVTAGQGDHLRVTMRVKQRHVITVVMDTAYDVTFGRLDPNRGYSVSRSTSISEIEAAGTAHEHALGSTQEHGFLWRQNTYWSYEQRDGGLFIQIESLSLTRAIPTGLGWAIGPFVQSVPRESLQFTLQAVSNAIRR